MRALFLGRFNPFHLGHLTGIENIRKEKDIQEIIIAIGSSDKSFSIIHPFSAGERLLMIKRALLENKIPLDSIHIVTIPDSNNNSLWVAQVENYSPAFDIVYSNNSLIHMLFSSKGYKVRELNMLSRENLNGTYIREQMSLGKDVNDYLPKSVIEYISEVDGFKRIKKLVKTTRKEHLGVSAVKYE